MKPAVSSPKLALKALLDGWGFKTKYIESIFNHFNCSFDQTDAYLDGMDGDGETHPKDYWIEFCRRERIEHEEDNNPFIDLE
jgi:hypothetical protein